MERSMSPTVVRMGPTDRLVVRKEAAAVVSCEEAACTKLAEHAAARNRERSGLDSILNSREERGLPFCARSDTCAQTLLQVVTNAQCIGDNREGRIYSRARREEAPVHDVQIV